MRITEQKIPHSHPVIMKVPNNSLTL
jgi:hypothetical protein